MNLTPSGQNGMVALMQDPSHDHARAMASGAAAGLQPGLTLQGESSLIWPEDDSVEHVETAFTLPPNAVSGTLEDLCPQRR